MVEVAYLSSRRREEFTLNRIVHWDVQSKTFVRHPVHPRLAERLVERGQQLPEGFTVADEHHRVDAGGGVAWS